jgi:hypothetical protein
VAAAPVSRPRRGRTNGHAYHMDTYESVVGQLLDRVSVDAAQLTAVVGQSVAATSARPDQADLDRVTRQRQKALDRFVRDRDHGALDQAMAALDREEAAVHQASLREAKPVPADAAVRYLRELPVTWAKAQGGHGRQLLASALFDRIDVLGLQEMAITLSAHAARYGMGEVLPAELRLPVNGRGERI